MLHDLTVLSPIADLIIAIYILYMIVSIGDAIMRKLIQKLRGLYLNPDFWDRGMPIITMLLLIAALLFIMSTQ